MVPKTEVLTGLSCGLRLVDKVVHRLMSDISKFVGRKMEVGGSLRL